MAAEENVTVHDHIFVPDVAFLSAESCPDNRVSIVSTRAIAYRP